MIFLENFKTPLNFYIPNEEGLRFMKEALNKSQNKNMFIEPLIELAELVLKDNYFKSNDRFRIRKRVPLQELSLFPFMPLFSSLLQRDDFQSIVENNAITAVTSQKNSSLVRGQILKASETNLIADWPKYTATHNNISQHA